MKIVMMLEIMSSLFFSHFLIIHCGGGNVPDFELEDKGKDYIKPPGQRKR